MRLARRTTAVLTLSFIVCGCGSIAPATSPAKSLALSDPSRSDCLTPVLRNKPSGYHPTEWSIGILTGSSPVSLYEPRYDLNPVLTAMDVTDRAARFVADPFMLRDNDEWHLYFEVMNCGTEQGDIGHATSSDGLNWKYDQVVLDESFHLSYPYVFEYAGTFWMIPETRQAGAIRLYQAPRPEGPWKLHADLVQGDFADSSLIRHDGLWWIFAVEGGYSLAIYYSEHLEGQYTRHPATPLFKDDRSKTRPGGRMIEQGGKVIRFAQDNTLRYGHQVRAFEIDQLSPTLYADHELLDRPVFGPEGHGWREVAGHTVDPHSRKDGTWIAVVDGAGYRAR